MTTLPVSDNSPPKGFTVRRMVSVEEVKFAWRLATDLGWRPGLDDPECFFAADPTGFFVGELDGQKICCIFAVKYGDRYACLGDWMVLEDFRGRGYGSQTLAAGIASLGEGYNIAVNAVESKVQFLERRGFCRGWLNRRYQFTAAAAASALSESQIPTGVIIEPVAEINFESLFTYDLSVFGAPRRPFLEKWISIPSGSGWAATNNQGDVLGYIVVRKTAKPEDGRRIGPLFADSIEIARILCRAAVEMVAADYPMEKIVLDVPVGVNPDGLDLAEKELGGKCLSSNVRMFTKGLPDIPLKKTFGITALEVS